MSAGPSPGSLRAEQLETTGPLATEGVGARVAGALVAGDVVLVVGEIGAGKTTFVRGASRALGVKDPVTSPTFSIGHRYAGAVVTVAHLDLHRIAALEEEDPALLDDYLGSGTIAFLEWPPDRVPLVWGASVRATVRLEHAGGDRRRIEILPA